MWCNLHHILAYYDVGDWYLMLVTWLVTNIQILSPTQLVSNIRHQHRYNPINLANQSKFHFKWLEIKGFDAGFTTSNLVSRVKSFQFIICLQLMFPSLLTRLPSNWWPQLSFNQNLVPKILKWPQMVVTIINQTIEIFPAYFQRN